MTYAGPLAEYRAYYHRTLAEEAAFFSAGVAMVPPFPSNDFHDGSAGELFSALLPAGDYVFDGWQVASGPVRITGPMDTRVHFTVEPGKATYVGNFFYMPTMTIGLISGVRLAFGERFERDMAVFKALYPQLADVPVQRLSASTDTEQ